MGRIVSDAERRAVVSSPTTSPNEKISDLANVTAAAGFGTRPEVWIVRGLLILAIIVLSCTLGPFRLHGPAAAGAGFFMALLVLIAELRLRRATLAGLAGGVIGAVVGMFAALLVTLIVSRTAAAESTKSFLECGALFAFAYLGFMIGSEKSDALPLGAIGDRFLPQSPDHPVSSSIKLLDTSVLIDGRIADICEAQFIDGTLVVPKFVLHELQLVADSSDALKRPRGRRGLEVIDRIQKMPGITLQILEDGPSTVDEVDHKLVELALRTGAKIVTNDFNLNKVATVQGLSVLNVNQLANALKPVVLPGETLRVLVVRDGKEPGQGISYLDDGTMIVVDGARRFIGKHVDSIVTSVHQSPAGKMIFARVDERSEQTAAISRQAAAASAGRQVVPRSDPAALDRSRSAFPDPDPL
jgi:uncharacterized protein YacL